MEKEDTFRMPAISGMCSKTKQLKGLRTVRSAAVTAYKKLNNEQERMMKMMSELGKAWHGSHHQLEVGERYNVDTRAPPPLLPPPSPHTYKQGGKEIHYQS